MEGDGIQYQQEALSLVTLSRRVFFQKTGAAIAALGLAELAVELGVPEKATAYGQSLMLPFGQSAGRKLALLVGIDDYPNGTILKGNSASAQLKGCATDVALQRELLIHRFGFLPADIVCLTNEQATRAGIYEAFIDHLYKQATSGDVVVFHFSGYGSKVRFIEAGAAENGAEAVEVRSIVPFNGFLPNSRSMAVNDISEIELKSLLGQLKTNRVTTVLDAGFAEAPFPPSGGLRSRYRAEVAVGRRPQPFLLLDDQRLAEEADPFVGTLLRGAAVDRAVVERPWDDFSAGAFTYVMTQYLWSSPSPVSTEAVLARSQETLVRWGESNQQPEGDGGTLALKKQAPIYNAALIAEKRGSGVVQSVSSDGRKATLWLGGLPPSVLKYIKPQSTLSCAQYRLKIQSIKELAAQAKLVDADGPGKPTLQKGDPILEAVRILPKDISLVVALDSRLERIERVDATSALSALAFVTSTSGTDLPADCLLGKPVANSSGLLMASQRLVKIGQVETGLEENIETLSQVGYGLFSLTRSLIPGTLAQQDEAISPAVARLTPKLRTLLALKLLRLSENQDASLLSVRATLEGVAPEEKPLISRQTVQSVVAQSGANRNRSGDEGLLVEVPVGTRVRYRLFNQGDRPIYYTLIIVNSRERLSAFCPAIEGGGENENKKEASGDGVEQSAIAPGSSVAIPNPGLDWAVDSPTGPVETYVICSTQPLRRTFDRLLAADPGGSGQRISPLPEPLDVIESLLTDISRQDIADEYQLDMASWAMLNFTYQAV